MSVCLTFCDWGSLTFNKVKKFNTNLVKQEIEWISKNGIKFVDVADANFGIFKDRDFELLTYMVEQNKNTDILKPTVLIGKKIVLNIH